MIYFIKGKGTNYVKIGYSKDEDGVMQRLSALQTGNWVDLELLFTFDGGFDYEKYLHRFYDKYRVRGEWFDLTEVMSKEKWDKRIINFFKNKTKQRELKIEKEEIELERKKSSIVKDISRAVDISLEVRPDRIIKRNDLEMYCVRKFIKGGFSDLVSKYIFKKASNGEQFSDLEDLELFKREDVSVLIEKIKDKI